MPVRMRLEHIFLQSKVLNTVASFMEPYEYFKMASVSWSLSHYSGRQIVIRFFNVRRKSVEMSKLDLTMKENGAKLSPRLFKEGGKPLVECEVCKGISK